MNNKKKLRYIKTVMSTKNITKAAEELYISQSYLSKVLKNIEEEIGITLFKKTNSGSILTFAGERYLHYLKEINKLETKMINEFEMIKENKKGRLKLGINAALATHFLPKIMPKFKEKYPDIILELIEVNQNISEKELERNNVDLVFGISPNMNDNLSFTSIFDENLYLVVSKNSKFYNRELEGIVKFNKSLETLSDETMILLPTDYGIGKNVVNFFNENNLSLDINITTTTVPTAVNLTKQGLGSTFMPESLINELDLSDCNIYSFSKNILKNEYIIIYRKNEQLSVQATALMNIFLESLGN